MGQYDINLRDYWRIIRRRKIIIIFTTFTLSFFSFIFAKLNEPTPIYSASSALRIEQNTAVAGIVSDSDSFNKYQEMATQTAVIRSYPVMERVSKELGLIDKSLSSEDIAKNSRLVSVINGMADQVDSGQIGDTNIISVTVTSGDPDQAARMANTISSVFRNFDFETRNQAILKQFTFIKSQLEGSEARLRESEQKIKTFKENQKFLSLRVEAQAISRLLEASRVKVGELEKAADKIRDAIQQVRSIGEFTAGKTKRIPVDDIESGLGQLNNQLVELQVQRDTLLENFTDEHPSVRAVNIQIKNVIREMLLVLQGREHAIQTELRIRRKELASFEKRNKTIPDLSLQLQRLERQMATDMEVHNLLRQKMEEVNIKLAGRQHLVHIVKPAFRPTDRDNPPQIGVNTTLGAILGLIVGLAFALVVETMDTSIGTIEDVESFLEVPVLGVIPTLDTEELERQYLESNPDQEGRFTADIYGRLVTHFVPRSPIAEAYRSFRTQMDFLSLEKGGNIFLLTSATPGEGKTSTSINFAITYAQTNKRTLLIDCDMRKPTIYRIFGIDREPGVTDILLGNYNWEECIRTMTDIMLGKFDMEDIMLTPGLDNLNILTCGNIPPNPSELLNSPRMTEFLETLRSEFDVIILDTPPLLPVTDAAVLGTRVDGCVLVYRVGNIARGALKRAKLQLDNVRANVWGVVLNSMRAEATSDMDSFRYQSSYYYGGYIEEAGEENLMELPVYQRVYRKAKNLVIPSSGSDQLEQEASPLARAIGAAFVGLSFLSLGVGMAWQEGVRLPLLGALSDTYATIGTPPGGSLQNLDKTWQVTREKLSNRKAITSKPGESAGGSAIPPPQPPQKPVRKKEKHSLNRLNPLWQKKRAAFSRMPGSGISPASASRPETISKNLSTPNPEEKAAFLIAGLNNPPPVSPKTREIQPFSIIYSPNRNIVTTRHQPIHQRSLKPSPRYSPVPLKTTPWAHEFLGGFPSQQKAEAVLSKRVRPRLTEKKSGPASQGLPYTLQIMSSIAPGKQRAIQSSLKAVGLNAIFEHDHKGGGRILLGAFQKPEEARAAAEVLSREKIAFRLVAR